MLLEKLFERFFIKPRFFLCLMNVWETCLTGILWDVWELRDEEQRFLGLKRCEKLFQFGLWVKKIQNSEIKNSEHRN